MQRAFGGRSARLIIPVIVAVLAFISGSVFVAVGQSEPQTYYACADSGGGLKDIRVDSQPACRKGETLVSWSSGQVPNWEDLAGIPADLQDGSISWSEVDEIPSDVADGDDVGLTSVTWDDVQDVPTGFADGTDDVGLTSVTWGDVENVPAGFADDTDDVDGGTAADLQCSECVDSSEISDGAVTTTEQTANAMQIWNGSNVLSNGVMTTLGPFSVGIPFMPGGDVTDTQAVLVTAEIELHCSNCGQGVDAQVNLVLENQSSGGQVDNTAVYLDSPNQRESVTISELVFVPGGTEVTFVIQAQSNSQFGANVIVDDSQIILADLGRNP